jgi:hypothetical protein
MRAIYDDFKFVSTQQLGYSAWDDVYNVATNITQEDVDQFVADNYNDHFLEAGKLTLYVSHLIILTPLVYCNTLQTEHCS